MSNDNLKIWSSVEETDRDMTKTGDLGGRTITSINATYMIKQATKQFGPIGIGWGYEIIEERYDTASPIYDKEKNILGNEIDHTLRLKLWYKIDGERGEIEHFGHTPFIMRSQYGPYTDHEAPKKSLTDAIKKCLSMLGFSADIFMGLYDDIHYVQAIEAKQNIEKAEKHDEAYTEERTKFLEWLDRESKAYALIPNAATLKMVHTKHLNSAQRKCTVLNIPFEKAKDKLEAAYNARREEILPQVVCTGCGTESRDKPGNVCRECGGKKELAETSKEKE